WAVETKHRVLLVPDPPLGRHTRDDVGIAVKEVAVSDPTGDKFEYEHNIETAKILLWKGHCSVHQNFTVENIYQIRAEKPDMNIIVHPECPYETVAESDYAGSTSYIIHKIEQAKHGSKWAIGTEMNLVKRLEKQHPDKEII